MTEAAAATVPKRILVAVDGSPGSRAALRRSVEAAVHDASLEVVIGSFLDQVIAPKADPQYGEERAVADLGDHRSGAGAPRPDRFEAHVVNDLPAGDPGRADGAWLVVVGSRGRRVQGIAARLGEPADRPPRTVSGARRARPGTCRGRIPPDYQSTRTLQPVNTFGVRATSTSVPSADQWRNVRPVYCWAMLAVARGGQAVATKCPAVRRAVGAIVAVGPAATTAPFVPAARTRARPYVVQDLAAVEHEPHGEDGRQRPDRHGKASESGGGEVAEALLLGECTEVGLHRLRHARHRASRRRRSTGPFVPRDCELAQLGATCR